MLRWELDPWLSFDTDVSIGANYTVGISLCMNILWLNFVANVSIDSLMLILLLQWELDPWLAFDTDVSIGANSTAGISLCMTIMWLNFGVYV